MTAIETILSAAAKAEPSARVYCVWNALVVFIPEDDRHAAAERLAYTLAPRWIEHAFT